MDTRKYKPLGELRFGKILLTWSWIEEGIVVQTVLTKKEKGGRREIVAPTTVKTGEIVKKDDFPVIRCPLCN
ncbi:hypothetical protein ACP8HI_20835 [Paenibacillus sp. FA6]|uniref:hypothetical protein n=1 Tax=Paenibacillus sp. FA6 TaxID=3413029 RepID=UPI003F657004